MKKKFIAVSVLICALALGSTTLTSCVDDNESASVTAIRDAKAAQLNALAAEANAQAKVNEALANLRQAQADARNAQTDFEKKEYEARLEKLQAEYQQYIAEAQKKQAEAEQEMQTDLMEHQKTLYGNYKAAQKEVTDLSNQIAEKSIQVAKYEAGLVSAKAIAQEMLISANIEKQEAEAEKAAYEAMGENNYNELIQEAKDLEIKRQNQLTEITAKGNDYETAYDAFNKAKWAFEGRNEYVEGEIITVEPTLETGKAIKDLKKFAFEKGWNLLNQTEQYVDDESSTSITVYSLDEAQALRANAELDQNLLSYEAQLGTKEDKAGNYIYDHDGDPETANKIVIWTDINEDGIPTSDEFTTPTKWGEYLYWEKQYEDAKKAWENAKDENKDQYKIWMDQAEATMLEQKDLLITSTEKIITETKEEKEALKKATDAFTGDTYKAYTDAISAVLAKEGKALDAATEALEAAKLDLADIDGQIKAIDFLIGADGTVIDINAKIAECETAIALATEKIQRLEQLILLPGETSNSTAQTLLDDAKAELEDLNEQLAIAQAAEKSWKEQLEASLKGETSSVPETPAEGEETPAE